MNASPATDLFATSHFSNRALLLDTKAWVKGERTSTAVLLSRLAEIDERKLYLQLGYSSLFAYCVHELKLAEDSAAKRIHVARLARRFPGILVEIYQGRLHLTAVQMLARHLRSGNADDLLAEARDKTKTELRTCSGACSGNYAGSSVSWASRDAPIRGGRSTCSRACRGIGRGARPCRDRSSTCSGAC